MQQVLAKSFEEVSDLSQEDARRAMRDIMSGGMSKVRMGAFLLATQWKPTTVDEQAGYLDALLDYEVSTPILDPIDCTPYSHGVNETAVLGVGANVVAAAGGIPIAIYDFSKSRDEHAIGHNEILEALNITVSLPDHESSSMIDETRFGFYDAEEFSTHLQHLLDARQDIGIPTVFGDIDRFLNPGHAKIYVGSTPTTHSIDELLDSFGRSDLVEYEKVVCFDCIENYDIIDPSSPEIIVWENDKKQTVTLPGEIDYEVDDLRVADPLTETPGILREIFDDERSNAYRDAVTLTAATRMWAVGKAESIEEATEMADQLISTGKATEALETLQSFRTTGTQSLDW